jgi:hypothetical protein
VLLCTRGHLVVAVNVRRAGPQLLLKPPGPVSFCVNVIFPVAIFAVLNLPVTADVVMSFNPSFVGLCPGARAGGRKV